MYFLKTFLRGATCRARADRALGCSSRFRLCLILPYQGTRGYIYIYPRVPWYGNIRHNLNLEEHPRARSARARHVAPLKNVFRKYILVWCTWGPRCQLEIRTFRNCCVQSYAAALLIYKSKSTLRQQKHDVFLSILTLVIDAVCLLLVLDFTFAKTHATLTILNDLPAVKGSTS